MAPTRIRHFGLLQLRIRRVYVGQLCLEATRATTGSGRPEETAG